MTPVQTTSTWHEKTGNCGLEWICGLLTLLWREQWQWREFPSKIAELFTKIPKQTTEFLQKTDISCLFFCELKSVWSQEAGSVTDKVHLCESSSWHYRTICISGKSRCSVQYLSTRPRWMSFFIFSAKCSTLVCQKTRSFKSQLNHSS